MMQVRLTRDHFYKKSKLETIPEYYECPVCFMLRESMMECTSCKARACITCLEDFSKAEHQKNPNLKA